MKGFADLGRLGNIPKDTKPKRETSSQIEAVEFVKLLEQVYESDDAELVADVSTNQEIPVYAIQEVQDVLEKMKNEKAQDMSHIIIEMIKSAGLPFLEILVQMYNPISDIGYTPSNWHVTIFRMLPKGGDLSNVNNWRPIVVVPIS